MKFVPAGEIIGEKHQVRTVRITQNSQLPSGEYSFVDMYCSDPSCDCRKAMIQVLHNGVHVATINYGWESPEFYKKWMGGDKEDNEFSGMSGASIDFSSPNYVSGKGILGLFKSLLNDTWVAKMKYHYKEVKDAVLRKSK